MRLIFQILCAVAAARAKGARAPLPTKNEINQALRTIVTPLMGYYVCDWVYGAGIDFESSALVHTLTLGQILDVERQESAQLQPPGRVAEGPLEATQKSMARVRPFDSIYCNCKLFDEFVAKALPLLPDGVSVVLVTGSFGLPMIHRAVIVEGEKEKGMQVNKAMYQALSSPKVAFWLSQNPIFLQHRKYGGWPYGVDFRKATEYVAARQQLKLDEQTYALRASEAAATAASSSSSSSPSENTHRGGA
jgi:hypothetical protein